MSDAATQYPEHEKLAAISDESQAIGEFLEWLLTDGRAITRHFDDDGPFGGPTWEYDTRSIQTLLADYFHIDRAKIAAEKDAMVDALRAANAR